MLETQPDWHTPSPKTLGWHIGLWNLIGAVGFTLCGELGFASGSSQACELASLWSTFIGSWAFLVRSVRPSAAAGCPLAYCPISSTLPSSVVIIVSINLGRYTRMWGRADEPYASAQPQWDTEKEGPSGEPKPAMSHKQEKAMWAAALATRRPLPAISRETWPE